MGLEVGLNVDLQEACSMRLELGGAYYDHRAATEGLGLQEARVRVNHVDGVGWSAPIVRTHPSSSSSH
jgi:hypothetical protein